MQQRLDDGEMMPLEEFFPVIEVAGDMIQGSGMGVDGNCTKPAAPCSYRSGRFGDRRVGRKGVSAVGLLQMG